jgi:hypothetical protein
MAARRDERAFLLEQVARIGRLLNSIVDQRTEEALRSLAAEYEARAAKLELE